MNREMSAYLDCARLLGALLVLAGHTELNWVPGIWWYLIPLGNESVAILFVVSGFVIGFVSDARETTLRSYLIHRSARAYSIVLPCIIFGFLLDAAGKHFLAHYYLHQSWPPLASNFQEIKLALFSLTFLGGVWGSDIFPGSMAPFWTFPYEWAYYLLFGAAWYLRGWGRGVFPIVILAIFGPQILIFAPLWLMGFAAYWLVKRLRWNMATGKRVFYGASLVFLACNGLAILFNFSFGFGAQESPDLWPFYLTGLVFAAMSLGFRFSGISIANYTGWAKWAAGASATIYLMHFPLGRLLNGLVPPYWDRLERWPLIVLPVIAISLLFAEIGERRKEAWRHRIEAGLGVFEKYLPGRKLAQEDI